MKARRIFSFSVQGITLFIFIYLLIFPKYAAEPTRTALGFCATALIPGLFIYMVLAKLIAGSIFMRRIERILGLEAIALILGTVCGCPLGAKNALWLYEDGRITKKQAEYLCSFSNNASLSFVVGFVGGELLGDIRLGLILLVFQLIASTVTAVVMKYLLFCKEGFNVSTQSTYRKTSLWEAISDSGSTMISLCACVVFFVVIGEVFTGLIPFSPTWEAVFKSILEFSSGCGTAAEVGKNAFVISAFALGQMGASVALQVKSIVGNRLSVRPYIMGKIISGAVMTALAIIFG